MYQPEPGVLPREEELPGRRGVEAPEEVAEIVMMVVEDIERKKEDWRRREGGRVVMLARCFSGRSRIEAAVRPLRTSEMVFMAVLFYDPTGVV